MRKRTALEWRAEPPAALSCSKGAPSWSSSRTQPAWPFAAAQCSAVLPTPPDASCSSARLTRSHHNLSKPEPTPMAKMFSRCSREEEKRCGAPSFDHGLERDGLAALGRCEPSLYQRTVHRRPRHRDQHRRLQHTTMSLERPRRQKTGRWLGAAAYRPAAHGAFLLGELLLLVLPSLRRDLTRDDTSPVAATTHHHRSQNTATKTQPGARHVRKRRCRSGGLTGGVR